MTRLHLGCGRTILPGWLNLDAVAALGVDLVVDLEDCSRGRIPLENDSVDEMLASHVLEHVRGILPLMEELHRVAREGCALTVRVPYGSSDDAWEDPTHVRAFFLQSFGYFGQPFYWRADYGYRGDWDVERIDLTMRDAALRGAPTRLLDEAVRIQRNVVEEMVATLRAVKPIRPASADLRRMPPVYYRWG
jgi:SAM-dependent methyltransferase